MQSPHTISYKRKPGTTGATGRAPKRQNRVGLPAFLLLVSILPVSLFHQGCARHSPTIDPAVHRAEIEKWQAKRNTGLMKETGWLTLSGLGWLSDGENSVGSDSSNVVVLPPGKAPARIGSIELSGEKIVFRSSGEATITHDGATVNEIEMFSDAAPEPTILKTGTLSFYVIKRADQLGVRIKDTESAARRNFRGLDFYPIDVKWRLNAKFHPYNPPKWMEIPTQAGTVQRDSCPGSLAFEIDGTEYRIDAVIERGSEDKLFIMFADATNGEETYAVGRQMYTPHPDSNNNVILDFNLAFNWPCVFTPFSTCPIPPRQNTIAHRVEAGEKMYGKN
jgi:uncharacterized protein (DUF1684 family)